MSIATNTGAAVQASVAKSDLVTATIDGVKVSVPKGTVIIRAAEQLGIDIPRFCDHPLLDPVAACRQCLVEIPDAGNGRAMKPQPACAQTIMPNMVIETANTNPKVAKEQAGMLEFLLINHPLDCPICDKGGECPLQNQSMHHGRGESRYEGAKRTYAKPVHISPVVLLDRERCVLCQRCTRFSAQISGDDFISLAERGALSQISSYATDPYDSYFSGNIIQICPVGALTSADYRFQSRPFDLVSTTTTCEHCAAGCTLRTDHRHYQVKRRMAGNDPQVNDEWNCDKGRFGFRYARGDDRLVTPLVRRDGVLAPASWPEAIDVAATALKAAGDQVGVLTGGRLSLETAYSYSRFARAVLGTNNIDFRARPSSAEETDFLASQVAGRSLDNSVSYADLDRVKRVVLVAFEPEDESPIVFLRLRKAWRKHKLEVLTLAPYASRGSVKLGATLIPTVPGAEAVSLARLQADGKLDDDTIVLVGERAGVLPGVLSAVAASGARFAWIPRRAGEIAAIEAGCLPGLLPGGRRSADPSARVDLQAAWGVDRLPEAEGLDATAMFGAKLAALVVSGVQPEDFADPQAVRQGLSDAGFVLSLEQRRSEVTELADVVLPVALLEEQNGTFLNWEHRMRPVSVVNRHNTAPMTEVRVLAALADALGANLGVRTPAGAKAAFDEIADWAAPSPASSVAPDVRPPAHQGLVLASWRLLIDRAAGLDGAEALLANTPAAVARLSAATAARLAVAAGDNLAVHGDRGDGLVLPVVVEPTMVDDVVWVPANSLASINQTLGVLPGSPVSVQPAGGAA